MSLQDMFGRAIKTAGAKATVYREETVLGELFCSVQPQGRIQQDSVNALGSYRPRNYLLYAPAGEMAAQMREEDRVAYLGMGYRLVEILPFVLAGKTLYYRAVLIREQEGSEEL